MKIKDIYQKLKAPITIVTALSLMGWAYLHRYGDAWKEQSDLAKIIETAPRVECIVNAGDNLDSLRQIYFPINEEEFKEVNKLHAHIDWKDYVADNTWINQIKKENPKTNIFYEIGDLVFGKGVQANEKDTISVPYRP